MDAETKALVEGVEVRVGKLPEGPWTSDSLAHVYAPAKDGDVT
jgi:hypothetical protein